MLELALLFVQMQDAGRPGIVAYRGIAPQLP